MAQISWIERVKNWFRKDERAVVFRVTADRVSASLYRVSFPQKKITLMRRLEKEILSDERTAFRESFQRIAKKILRRKPHRIVAVLDPEFATTVHSSVLLVRDTPEKPIDESDLEQHIAQGIWRFYDRERTRAAEKMGIENVDIVLHDAHVRRIRLDEHKVVNPLGFKARVIELAMSQTFSTKECLHLFEDLGIEPDRFLLTEAGTAVAECIARGKGEAPFYFVLLSETDTALYRREGTTIAYVDSFAWGRRNIVRGVASALGAPEAVAETIVALFLRGEASDHFLHGLRRVFAGELQLLMNGIALHMKETTREAYLSASFELPSFLYSPAFARHASSRVKLIPADTSFITTLLGFKWGAEENGSAPLHTCIDAAGLLAFYFLPTDATIDTIARRHARWLVKE